MVEFFLIIWFIKCVIKVGVDLYQSRFVFIRKLTVLRIVKENFEGFFSKPRFRRLRDLEGFNGFERRKPHKLALNSSNNVKILFKIRFFVEKTLQRLEQSSKWSGSSNSRFFMDMIYGKRLQKLLKRKELTMKRANPPLTLFSHRFVIPLPLPQFFHI